MNSSTPPLQSWLSYQLSPTSPTSKAPTSYIVQLLLCLSLRHHNSPYPCLNKEEKKEKTQKQQQQQQEVEVKGCLPLFDIYKSLCEIHDAHPCECIRTSVITTRQACVLSLCCCMVEVSRTSALMSTWRRTACVSWIV